MKAFLCFLFAQAASAVIDLTKSTGKPSTILLAPNDEVVIKLNTQGGTGYTWVHNFPKDNSIVVLVKETTKYDHPEGFVGGETSLFYWIKAGSKEGT